MQTSDESVHRHQTPLLFVLTSMVEPVHADTCTIWLRLCSIVCVDIPASGVQPAPAPRHDFSLVIEEPDVLPTVEPTVDGWSCNPGGRRAHCCSNPTENELVSAQGHELHQLLVISGWHEAVWCGSSRYQGVCLHAESWSVHCLLWHQGLELASME